jgi:hypothetical protein
MPFEIPRRGVGLLGGNVGRRSNERSPVGDSGVGSPKGALLRGEVE